MKHRILLLLVLLLGVLGNVNAEDVKYLIINYGSSGQQLIISLADEPVITFSGDDMIVTESSRDTVITVPMAEIASAPLVSDITGIKGILAGHEGQVIGGHVILKGAMPGSTVSVYAISGAMAKLEKTGNDGYLDLDLTTLKRGTYIVKTPSGSFKVRR